MLRDILWGLVLAVIVVVTFLLAGCGGWQKTMHTSLNVAHQTGKLSRGVAETDFCRPAVTACNSARKINPDDKCPGLSECQATRRLLIEKLLPSIQRAVLVGLLALQAEKVDKNKLAAAVTAAIGAVGLVHEVLLTWGLKL